VIGPVLVFGAHARKNADNQQFSAPAFSHNNLMILPQPAKFEPLCYRHPK